jgi:kynurenine formamidase
MQELLDAVKGATIYDLAQPYFVGMPHFPTHPPYLYSLNKRHGDLVTKSGASSAAETITLGGHVGTHIDALCHFSCDGKLFGGIEAEPIQSYDKGISELSVDTIQPILRRGVLIDVAGHFRLDVLPSQFVITPEQIDEILEHQCVQVERGDVVLFRTGWARHWRDQRQFITAGGGKHVEGPGPEEPAAMWLSARKVFAAGSDTVAFERVPSPDMPVHVHLLVENGIHIIECLNLETLAAERIYEFLFVAAPLRIEGGTGSPLRPFAVHKT